SVIPCDHRRAVFASLGQSHSHREPYCTLDGPDGSLLQPLDLREQLRTATVILLEQASQAEERGLSAHREVCSASGGGVCATASPQGPSDHDRSLQIRNNGQASNRKI